MNKEFEKRRRKLAKLIGKDGIAVIPTASTRVRSRDTDYPYRPDSDFYYFTGFSEPNAVMILAPGREDGSFIVCLREKNPLTEIWDGHMEGLSGVKKNYEADQSFDIEDLETILSSLFLIKILCLALIFYVAFKLKTLSLDGFLGAFLMGVIIILVGSQYFFMLLAIFFILSSVLSKILKRASFYRTKGSQRDIIQVYANGGIALLLSVIFDNQVDVSTVAFTSLAASSRLSGNSKLTRAIS